MPWKPQPNEWEMQRVLDRLAAQSERFSVLTEAIREAARRAAPAFAALGEALRKSGLPEAHRWHSPKRRRR